MEFRVRSRNEDRDPRRGRGGDAEQIPRRAGGSQVRPLRERVSPRPLGRLGAEADHTRAGRARPQPAQVPPGAAAASGRLMRFAGRHLVLGVSGGIACYKSCTLARRLTEDGAVVDVVLTASAAEFVRPVTFETLTGRPVLTSLWERDRALAHIGLAKQPDLAILAPATANVLARAAMGLADDVLTALLLARRGPVLAAPAMNDAMYAHPATLANLKTLAARGWHFIGPDTGALAEGPSDRPGRMSEPEAIQAAAARLLVTGGCLTGKTVVVTAGPTREHLDPVRVITNPSSGRMGYALAAAAYARGADVVLVAGPTELPLPLGVTTHRGQTTAEMQRAVGALVKQAGGLFMPAGPAHFRPTAHSPDRPSAR